MNDDIAFTDVILNTFAILLLLLITATLSFQAKKGEAPTRNSEELTLLPIRDCYNEAVRKASKFILVTYSGIQEISYDEIALIISNSGKDVAVLDNTVTAIQIQDQSADANDYSLLHEFEQPPLHTRDILDLTSWTETALTALDEQVYSRGYVPYFEVPVRSITEFSSLYWELQEQGASFRWRIAYNNTLKRLRTPAMFDSADFCR